MKLREQQLRLGGTQSLIIDVCDFCFFYSCQSETEKANIGKGCRVDAVRGA